MGCSSERGVRTPRRFRLQLAPNRRRAGTARRTRARRAPHGQGRGVALPARLREQADLRVNLGRPRRHPETSASPRSGVRAWAGEAPLEDAAAAFARATSGAARFRMVLVTGTDHRPAATSGSTWHANCRPRDDRCWCEWMGGASRRASLLASEGPNLASAGFNRRSRRGAFCFVRADSPPGGRHRDGAVRLSTRERFRPCAGPALPVWRMLAEILGGCSWARTACRKARRTG